MTAFLVIVALVVLCSAGVAFLVYKAVKSKKVQKVVAQVDSTINTVEQKVQSVAGEVKK